MIENASVQQVVTQALAAAVKKSKKGSKGLLSRAETTAESSAELADLQQDLAATLGEMGSNDHDEDELMAELDALTGDVATLQVRATPQATPHATMPSVPDGFRMPESLASV